MYGRTLAHTGAALAGVAVLGHVVPWYAIAAAALVLVGALVMRAHAKLKSR
jgi:hypothetical protein